MTIIFATQNENKVKEIQKLMPDHIKIQSLKDINCNDDIPETASTLEGNANLKSSYVIDHFNVDCFADDTGLEIEILNGEPGVRSARYANESGRSDDNNMNLVLSKLKNESNRKAQFRTVISLKLNGQEELFEGICKGKIAKEKSGNKGFGYDPIFIPEGYEISFADMSMTEKNGISHRGRAVQKLVAFLNQTSK
ncbi:MAG: non-canonical purine NTP diphosphatase [Crocinitomicaceae bacterium]